MKLYSSGHELPIKQFTFPDGQRHVELLAPLDGEVDVRIESRIANADELFDVLLLKSILDAQDCAVSLDIRYLLGARMDRRINNAHPATLEVVCRQLKGALFEHIRVLDAHSSMALGLLKASLVLPFQIVEQLLDRYVSQHLVVVAPDKGATQRVERLVNDQSPIVQCRKLRDSETGRLSGFAIDDPSMVRGKACLIIDDICDGGGTFTGLAKVLRDAGAVDVDLFVTHGIFSKGPKLEGISDIYTTDSYHTMPGVTTFPIQMSNL